MNCDVQRCKRRVGVQLTSLGSPKTVLCKTHANARADRMFSLLIRRAGKCAAREARDECLGPLQCAHIHSRRYRNIRWDERNAVCLCARHHAYFTRSPLEWQTWVEAHFPGRWDELRRDALYDGRPDMEEILVSLEGKK